MKVLTWMSLRPACAGATVTSTTTWSDRIVTPAAPLPPPAFAVTAGIAFTSTAVTARITMPRNASAHTDRRRLRHSARTSGSRSISVVSSAPPDTIGTGSASTLVGLVVVVEVVEHAADDLAAEQREHGHERERPRA